MESSMKRPASLCLLLLTLLVLPGVAHAFDLTGGVNVGGVLVGTRPRFGISPNAGIAWRTEGGFLLAIGDSASILPATDSHGVGLYNHTSLSLGYAWTSGRFGVGPAFAVYSTPACGQSRCGRLTGVSPGGTVQLDYYFSDIFGISAIANVDWLTGSLVLPPGLAAAVFVGPSLKWSGK